MDDSRLKNAGMNLVKNAHAIKGTALVSIHDRDRSVVVTNMTGTPENLFRVVANVVTHLYNQLPEPMREAFTGFLRDILDKLEQGKVNTHES